MATYRNGDKKPHDNILKMPNVTQLADHATCKGGSIILNDTHKKTVTDNTLTEVSESTHQFVDRFACSSFAKSCFYISKIAKAADSKIIAPSGVNATSAFTVAPIGKGKFLPPCQVTDIENRVNSTKLRSCKTDNIEPIQASYHMSVWKVQRIDSEGDNPYNLSTNTRHPNFYLIATELSNSFFISLLLVSKIPRINF